jgi:hypothetical protein
MAATDYIVDSFAIIISAGALFVAILFAVKSYKTAKESTEIAKNVYLSSIRPHFEIKSEAKGIAPLHIDRDIYNERLGKDIIPGWWSEFPYIYLKNVGNGSAIDVEVILTHSLGKVITIPLGNIAKGSETVVFIIPKERKADVEKQGKSIRNYIKLNYVDQDFATKGKVNKATIVYKDLDNNPIKPIEIILPFKETS